MDVMLRRTVRAYEESPTSENYQRMIHALLKAGKISAHKAYYKLAEQFDMCQCNFPCQAGPSSESLAGIPSSHLGRGDRVPCSSCGGYGGEHLEDGWMACYRCGQQGYEVNDAGYCFNVITPYNEVRIDDEIGQAWDSTESIALSQLAGRRICQDCDNYLQSYGIMLPEHHAPIRHWEPPSPPVGYEDNYYDYIANLTDEEEESLIQEEQVRRTEIVDPGCLCPACYPHPEREALIDLYRVK